MKRKGGEPANDNVAAANDNHKRAHYMRGYMQRRRRGAKTLRQLLRDSLDIIVPRAPIEDAPAQAYIAAVRDLLAVEPPADHAQDAS